MHCCKPFHVRFCLSYPSVKKNLYLIFKACVGTPQRTGQSLHAFVATGSGFLHSLPYLPLLPFDPPHFSRLPCRQSCSVEDLVTPLMTAAVRLYYQLNSVNDTLNTAEPCFHSPSGNIYIGFQTPLSHAAPPHYHHPFFHHYHFSSRTCAERCVKLCSFRVKIIFTM